MSTKHLTLPLKEEDVRSLHVGDVVTLTGRIFTARDMAHLKLKELYQAGKALPKDFQGAAVFHAGPVCLKNPDGSWYLNVIGPTTSIRMEPYADLVGKLGVRAVLGKGGMAEDTLRACGEYGYVYLQALWDLNAVEFGPLVVGMDTHGNSIYKTLKENAVRVMNEIYPE